MASFYAPIFHRENNNEKIKESVWITVPGSLKSKYT